MHISGRSIRAGLLLCGVVLCIFPFVSVYAAESSVRITEILYNAEGADTGKEYVEVINVGPGQIDMATVKFFERNDSNGRGIVQSRGSTVLQAGDVAVIVADSDLFLQSYEEYGLDDVVILDTSGFALLNAGSTVSLKQGARLLHSVTYSTQDGAQGDGDALHIADNDTISADNSSIGSVRGIAINTNAITTVADITMVNTGVSVSDGAIGGVRLVFDPSVIFSSSEAKFSVVQVGDDGEEQVLSGSWNFGDGTYVRGGVITHSYLYPGVYIITFQGYKDGADEGESVSLQREVVALFPQVTIERVDEAFVRLHNHHSFVLDVSGWQIVSANSIFRFPDNSLISSQSGIVVPFAIGVHQDVYFVTAGGGQFSGRNRLLGREVAEVVTDGGVSGTEGDLDDTVVDSTPSVRSVSDVDTDGVGNGGFTGDDSIIYELEDGDLDDVSINSGTKESSIKIIIVWVALLLGIISIALVPLFFSQEEDRRRRKTED